MIISISQSGYYITYSTRFREECIHVVSYSKLIFNGYQLIESNFPESPFAAKLCSMIQWPFPRNIGEKLPPWFFFLCFLESFTPPRNPVMNAVAQHRGVSTYFHL